MGPSHDSEPPPVAGGEAEARAGLRVTGSAVVYRLFDVGYEIDLARAYERLAPQAPERARPVRVEGQAIRIQNPPLTVGLGAERVALDGIEVEAEISARVFDFGVASIRIRLPSPPNARWAEYAAFASRVHAAALGGLAERSLQGLITRLGHAIERPRLAPVTEDYIVHRIDRLTDDRGGPASVEVLADDLLHPLILAEARPISPGARRELLPYRFSYYADDLAVLAWSAALVVEPVAEDTDIQYVLEFANAQLLELRVYDQLLDDELPRMYARIAGARRGAGALFRRRYAPLLAELQTRVADVTEIVERVDNALKVTDDVYLARVYSAALEIFRGRAWRNGIDRKLEILHNTYAMLNDAAQADRMEALEVAIVVLIVAEIVMSLVRR